MKKMSLILLSLILILSQVRSECPNACSSHGQCGAFDMCTCFKNWMGGDCSESKISIYAFNTCN